MRFKIQLGGLNKESKQEQPSLLIQDWSLNMVLYKLGKSIDTKSNQNMTGVITPEEIDQAIAQVIAFQNGYCNLNEQHAMLLLKSTLEWAKRYGYSVEWSKA